MAKKTVTLDPDDDLIIGEVGPWATEKHERLRKYIQASHGARARFLRPQGTGGASYIELYSGAGRSLITGTNQIIDGSAVAAFKAGLASGHPFSEMHLSDLEAQNSAALAQRIKALCGSAASYVGDANVVVDQVMRAINPRGLHLAFLDPFSLAQLPFSIIERMLRVQRMDMIIHVSLQDLQRNLDKHSRVGGALDIFAPGWRDAVDLNQATAALRAAFIDYWLGMIRSLGTNPATGIPLIVGEKNQRLYWLVFLSSNPLGQKLWNAVQNLSGQGSLF
jgi:three-Cys-motif partner protein